MKNKRYKVLGLMSGTSLDGLDLACTEFWLDENNQWKYSIIHAKTKPYSENWRRKLSEAIHLSETDHQRLDEEYGLYIGKTAKKYLDSTRFPAALIGSHGHTSHHQPHQGISKQLGAGSVIAEITQLPTISDFRIGDVQRGGQGAPLVPIGDALLFGEYTACLNLGGIANISFDQEGKRIAFDIGLANMGLNDLMKNESPPYDDQGEKAKKGKLQHLLLKQLNALPYFDKAAPKSTGIEWYLAEVKPLIDKADFCKEDKLRTLIEHMTQQIIRVLPLHQGRKPSQLLVTGGGAHNRFWMQQLRHSLPANYWLKLPDRQLIDFKEALVFAFMALLRQEGQINILSTVTGAREDSSGGQLHLPA